MLVTVLIIRCHSSVGVNTYGLRPEGLGLGGGGGLGFCGCVGLAVASRNLHDQTNRDKKNHSSCSTTGF